MHRDSIKYCVVSINLFIYLFIDQLIHLFIALLLNYLEIYFFIFRPKIKGEYTRIRTCIPGAGDAVSLTGPTT